MFKNTIQTATKLLAVAGVAFAATTSSAVAEHPENPVTLVIPYGAGGSHDLNSQVVTSIIPQYLSQAMIVQLSPGAGGQKATQEVANAEADGYTQIFSMNYLDMLTQHVDDLPCDPMEDFVPVARINYAPIAVIVNADSGGFNWSTQHFNL